MTDVHPQAELAPRDIVSHAIVRAIAKQGGQHVWLDCRHIADFDRRFPSIAALLRRFELDPAVDLIPVHPAAHYMVGGVRTDLHGRTDVPGCTPSARLPAPGCTAPTVWRATRCLKPSCWARRAGGCARR